MRLPAEFPCNMRRLILLVLTDQLPLARLVGQVLLTRFHLSDFGVYQDLSLDSGCARPSRTSR